MARKSRVYHLYDNEEYVGAYTCREIAEKTGCPAYRVCVDARNMTRYAKRWSFAAVDEDPGGWAYDFTKKWNDARIETYKKAGKTIQICAYCNKIIEGQHMYLVGSAQHMHYKCFKAKCEGGQNEINTENN